MTTDNNLKLRGEILEHSLILEEAVNNLLLFNLGIYDGGTSTKLFGKKVGISFKNKIDLLYDIDVITKEENFDLELFMIFRNKFLHDIKSNSFLSIIEELDNGIKNKFKLYLEEGKTINDESSCNSACTNLFLKNLKTIRLKIKGNREKIGERNEIIQLHLQQIIHYNDLFFGLIDEVLLILENSELENEKLRNLSDTIMNKCQEYIDKLNSEEFVSIKEKMLLFMTDLQKVKRYLGVSRIDRDNFTRLQTEINVDILKLQNKHNASNE